MAKEKCGIGKIWDSKIESCRKMSKSEKKSAVKYGVKKGLEAGGKMAVTSAVPVGASGFNKKLKKSASKVIGASALVGGLKGYSDLRRSQRKKKKKK